MIRLDMSEYMEKHTVARMIGAPPGYVGYEEGGALTEAVRRRPYQVVLFDEIEKAHPDVFNVLLQVLDDGRLTDGHGRTVDFRNTLIVMTSNLGSEHLAHEPGENEVIARERVLASVRDHFRPEFLNRLDDMIVFHRLTRDQMTGIVEIQLKGLQKLLDARKISLALDEAARAWLADAGFDPVYGARPLKRVIQRTLQNPLATLILEGKIADGETVPVSARRRRPSDRRPPGGGRSGGVIRRGARRAPLRNANGREGRPSRPFFRALRVGHAFMRAAACRPEVRIFLNHGGTEAQRGLSAWPCRGVGLRSARLAGRRNCPAAPCRPVGRAFMRAAARRSRMAA